MAPVAAGPPPGKFGSFPRLAHLPPYVLAAVDELKSRLRAEGHDVFDFGLGNPDGPSPAAVIDRLTTEARRAGNQRYMPSKGLPEVRRAICDWYQRRYGQTFDPDRQAVLLCAGDKSGGSQKRFYKQLLKAADARFDEWLKRER